MVGAEGEKMGRTRTWSSVDRNSGITIIADVDIKNIFQTYVLNTNISRPTSTCIR